MHHPVAYHRAGGLFEDLYRTRQADPARAAVAHFRAHQFGRCAALAAGLPDESALEPDPRQHFTPGATPADVRRLGPVAREAAALPRDAPDLRWVRRVTELRSSALRLKYLASDVVWRTTLDTAEGRRWHASLAAQLERERAEADRGRSAIIGEYVRETLNAVAADLEAVQTELSR